MKRKLLLIVLLLCGIMINAEAASYSGTLSATYTYDASTEFSKAYSIYNVVYACRPANAVSTRYVRTITPNYIKADGSTMSCTDYHQTKMKTACLVVIFNEEIFCCEKILASLNL